MQREFQPTVYLLASRKNGGLYTGVTSDLIQRIHEHREGVVPGFTKEHGLKRLVWFEQHSTRSTRSRAKSGSRSGVAFGGSN